MTETDVTSLFIAATSFLVTLGYAGLLSYLAHRGIIREGMFLVLVLAPLVLLWVALGVAAVIL